MIRTLLIGIAAVVVIGLGVLAWLVFAPGPSDFAPGPRVALADYHGADPTGVPAELKNASLIARGEYLTKAADCAACHTAKGGVAFAGGLPFVLPFGTLYSPNITPDTETGIGHFSDADFLRALHQGKDDENVPLYPAMPYASYTGMTDADALAIKAYLFSLKPVHADVPENALVFPFNQRWLMGIWGALFNSDKRFEPNTAQSPQWNRGAYLVENMEHCGECHTPRNLAFALDNRSKFKGATQAGWRAYNITSDSTSGVGAWSATQLEDYLAIGHTDGHGGAAGPMGEAVENSLRYLTKDDIAAIVTYLRSVPAIVSHDLPNPKEAPAPASHRLGVAEANPRGKAIFAGSCASCHDWTGVSPLTKMAMLTGVRAVNDTTATNVAQIVMAGIRRKTPQGPIFMPGFGASFSDIDVATVSNYVTARFGAEASHLTAGEVAKLRKTSSGG